MATAGRVRRSPAWIDGLLRGEGIVDASGELWLHAFPRVLGYAFKPVSFWFCHRDDGALRAVVCEVNNTFGERHCYLLVHRDGRPIVDGEELDRDESLPRLAVLRRRGRLSIPLCAGARTRRGAHRVRRHPRRRAAADHDQPVGSPRAARRPGPCCRRSSGCRLFSFGVMARIHWHALQLFIKRTPFFSKPAPPTAQVTR